MHQPLSLIDPALLRYVEETREYNTNMASVATSVAAIDPETPEGLAQMRALMEPGGPYCGPLSETAFDRSIDGAGGPIVLRVFMPPIVQGVYLSIHGGGFSIGNRMSMDAKNSLIADQCNVVVISPEYRLAPEHPYPAAQDDCETVAKWLVDNARHEFGTERLLIGGESAGGHLAAATLLRMRDRHFAVDYFVAANLDCGAYDLSRTPSQRQPNHPHSTLRTESLRSLVERYAPDRDGEALRDPDLSPLYADLEGLCPALFSVGNLDPLLDDSVFMAARWSLAGNHTELAVYPEGMHGVAGGTHAMGRVALDRQVLFITTHAMD